MNALNLAENIMRLRHERKITQEELADFVGVRRHLSLNGKVVRTRRTSCYYHCWHPFLT